MRINVTCPNVCRASSAVQFSTPHWEMWKKPQANEKNENEIELLRGRLHSFHWLSASVCASDVCLWYEGIGEKKQVLRGDGFEQSNSITEFHQVLENFLLHTESARYTHSIKRTITFTTPKFGEHFNLLLLLIITHANAHYNTNRVEFSFHQPPNGQKYGQFDKYFFGSLCVPVFIRFSL